MITKLITIVPNDMSKLDLAFTDTGEVTYYGVIVPEVMKTVDDITAKLKLDDILITVLRKAQSLVFTNILYVQLTRSWVVQVNGHAVKLDKSGNPSKVFGSWEQYRYKLKVGAHRFETITDTTWSTISHDLPSTIQRQLSKIEADLQGLKRTVKDSYTPNMFNLDTVEVVIEILTNAVKYSNLGKAAASVNALIHKLKNSDSKTRQKVLIDSGIADVAAKSTSKQSFADKLVEFILNFVPNAHRKTVTVGYKVTKEAFKYIDTNATTRGHSEGRRTTTKVACVATVVSVASLSVAPIVAAVGVTCILTVAAVSALTTFLLMFL